ncbi:MAG: Lrp/AsnC family transcriptional regulator [Acidimicrobiaceae bacterium]|nr:Lrp/AsnC family transcriptional regulator [Acidimicrobiaceae bacterium]
MQAYVLVQTEIGSSAKVLASVRSISQVLRVDGVIGPYDIVALVDADDIDGIGKTVVESIQVVPGVTRTLTCPVTEFT